MKIRITTAPPVNPVYGLMVGSEHEASLNLAKNEPRYWVNAKHGNQAMHVGVMSYEAEEIQDETANEDARQANEDAERLTNLLACIAQGVTSRSDAVWLRETLLGWLQIVVARGERLGYIFATDEQPIIDALAELQL